MSKEKKTVIALAEDAAKEKIEADMRKKAEKELKKWKRRAKKSFIHSLLLFSAGVLVGIHYKVILALIKGEELPEAPAWHTWCK